MQSETIDAIRAFHRKRCFAMETRKRADLSLGSSLRSWLGWRKDLPDDDRKRIALQAAQLIACGEKVAKGKKHDLSDTEEFKEHEAIILVAINSRAPTDEFEKRATKEMERLAKSLPVWEQFGEGIRGFGAGSLAVIIGEAGDLANYSTHSKLWKRMGLAVMDGVRQGGLGKGAGADAWIEHGYSPIRRSRMWNIGDTLMKGNKDGPYRSVYLARKQYERNRAVANGLTVAPSAKIPAKRRDEFISDGHIHMRSQRYMEKRLLRDLWKAWRRANSVLLDKATSRVPADEITNAPSGAAEAVLDVPARASMGLPPQLISDAAQAAGQANPFVPLTATCQQPDHQLPDAPQGAGEAFRTVPSARIALSPHQFHKIYDGPILPGAWNAVQTAGEAARGVVEKPSVNLPRRKSKAAA